MLPLVNVTIHYYMLMSLNVSTIILLSGHPTVLLIAKLLYLPFKVSVLDVVVGVVGRNVGVSWS